MSANQLLDLGLKVSVIPTNGAQTSGAPGRYGGMTGVALNNVLADTTVSMNFGFAVWSLLVDAHVNGGGGSAIAVGDTIFYTDATTNASHLNKDGLGYFFGYALSPNAGAGTATTIAVAHVPGGGILTAGAIGTAELAAASVIESKLVPGAAGAGITGLAVKFAADANVIGAIPVMHIVHITAGANGDTDVTLTHKTRVIDCWNIPTTTVANSTLQVKNVNNVLSDAMVAAVTGTVTRCVSLVNAQRDIAAGTVLRVTGAGGATMPAADVYVLGLRVA